MRKLPFVFILHVRQIKQIYKFHFLLAHCQRLTPFPLCKPYLPIAQQSYITITLPPKTPKSITQRNRAYRTRVHSGRYKGCRELSQKGMCLLKRRGMRAASNSTCLPSEVRRGTTLHCSGGVDRNLAGSPVQRTCPQLRFCDAAL
jgi:hypothetical protein